MAAVQPIGLRWQEARYRASAFASAWAGERRERAEKDTFWNELLAVFGVDRRQVARFEAVTERYSTGRTGFIDVFWPGRLLAEHKSAGEDLDRAMRQAMDYLPRMDPVDVPRLVAVSDFQNFVVRDLTTSTTVRFTLSELPDHIDLFGSLVGRAQVHLSDEDANFRAVELLTQFGDALAENGYGDHERRVLLTRVLFCLFADDAAVWPTGLFEDYLRLRTHPDGADLGSQLAYLFQWLNSPLEGPSRRPNHASDEVLDFIYVDGGLFAEHIPIANTDSRMRQALIEACRFNWSRISPAIFGSMFQNALTPAARRRLGAHYTTEQNILRTIRPLFLDDLEAQLAVCGENLPKLRAFRDDLGKLTFFDPACGCGNFLVIAYREVRSLELTCLVKIREVEARARARRGQAVAGEGQRALDVTLDSVVHVGQFYGIEIEEWPCRIAETAMHLTDHLANQALSAALGDYYARFPIADTAHITNGNALRTDWTEVLAPSECSYLFGNPPFAGQTTRGVNQTADLRLVWGLSYARWLDYVTAWYRVAANYINAGPRCAAAFVSTNSITQGEQVARMWRTMLDRSIKIDFAHRTFGWTSEARGRAQVHVVIIGVSHETRQPRRYVIYDYAHPRSEPTIEVVGHINPYLLPLPDILVDSRPIPISPAMPPVLYGNKPADGGHLIVEPEDLPASSDPAFEHIRRIIGARELTHDEERYCIWMTGPDAGAVRHSQWLRARLEGVRAFRAASNAPDTRKTATVPWRFFRIPQPTVPYLAIPRHVTGMRDWFTVAHQSPDVIASDALFTALDADGFLFGVLSSAMFAAWLRTVGGKIKSDPRFSAMVYNTFPLTPPSDRARQRVIQAGQQLLDARAAHPDLSLAVMYERLSLPSDILAAHGALDHAVDRIFGVRATLTTITERMARLFPAYEEMLGQLRTAAPAKRRARRT